MTRTEGIDLRDRPDGTLLKMRDTYLAETECAPPQSPASCAPSAPCSPP